MQEAIPLALLRRLQLAVIPVAVAALGACQAAEEFHRGGVIPSGSGGAIDAGGDARGSGGSAGGTGSGGRTGTGGIPGGSGGTIAGSGGAYTCGSGCQVQVSYKPNGASTSTIDGKLIVAWSGSASAIAPLTAITVRYWFMGPSSNPTGETFKCYYAQMGSTKITGKFAEAIPLRQNANAYLEIGFGADWTAGSYDTGEVQFQISGSNGYQFSPTTDHSYMDVTEFTPNPNMTAYVNGKLAWGTEPAAL